MRRIFPYLLFFLSVLLAGEAVASAQYDRNMFYYRGRQMLVDGKYSQAIDNLNVLIRLDPNSYEAYFFRGIAKYNLADYVGAEMDFDKTLDINPLYTAAYHYRAITLSRTGKYDQALNDLQMAVSLRPGYTGLYFSRGVTYLLSQQFEKAIEDFDRFISKEPKESDAYLNRGACYLFTGDTLKALSDYDKAITLNSFEPEGYIRRARVHYLRNDYQKALDDLDKAVSLDTTNTYAFFNRGLVRYDSQNFRGALEDLDRVLALEPTNSLTLYNRALIRAQTGAYNQALDDLDRVLEINPKNVLAYFNRASLFIELGRYSDAEKDYTRAIELYPDFAKAYMNRSYVRNQIGKTKGAKADYETAQEKVNAYRASQASGAADFADTTKKYNSLLSLDADFAKRDFNDEELLQNRSVDIKLKPMYRFSASAKAEYNPMLLGRKYESGKMDSFIKSIPVDILLVSREMTPNRYLNAPLMDYVESSLRQNRTSGLLFAKALLESDDKQFNSAVTCYDEAISMAPDQVFYYLNRGVLHAEMIDFISSIESNVQVLTLDNAGTTRGRVTDKSVRIYDYSAAISDMEKAVKLMPEFPYSYYNLGNLYCLSNEFPLAIQFYTKALERYAWIPEAYYNRGLAQIYLKEKEKGCMDLSKAGELGVQDAYRVIKKYCSSEEQ